MTFAIGSRFLKSQNSRSTLNASSPMAFLAYTCIFKPFKSLTNNAHDQLLDQLRIIAHSKFQIIETYCIIILHMLLFVALAQFVELLPVYKSITED